MLYEMLAGRAPFEGAVLEVLDKQFNATPPRLSTSSGFESLVYALLEKDPMDRPPSARAVLEAIDELEAERRPLEFADQTGVVYVERTAKESMPYGATVNESETAEVLPELELGGPTLMDTPRAEALPFDENEETMPSGIEPTVRKMRPRPASAASTNLRIVDEEEPAEADTYEALPARPTQLDLGAHDTDPDPEPPPIATRVVEQPMSPVVVRIAETSSPMLLMLIALLLAFCTTLAIGLVARAYLPFV
jgi:serine/threonine protein kinase